MTLPAAPFRASALLDLEIEHLKIPMSARTFLTGIKSIDQGLSSSLWTGGRLIGVVSGPESSLIEEIVRQHLLSCQERTVPNRDPGTGFIIAPHNSSVISNIHAGIVVRLAHPSFVENSINAVQYLENVRLLQYFDFAGLTESVAEVSALLFDVGASSQTQKTILYLEGVGAAMESSQRRSGMVQANALLSSLLRTLNHLSRTYPCLLILLDLASRKDTVGDDAIASAFASATGSDMNFQLGGASGRTLVRALDVVIAVHDAHETVTDGSMIVEVVKDRVGNALGQWAIWKSKK